MFFVLSSIQVDIEKAELLSVQKSIWSFHDGEFTDLGDNFELDLNILYEEFEKSEPLCNSEGLYAEKRRDSFAAEIYRNPDTASGSGSIYYQVRPRLSSTNYCCNNSSTPYFFPLKYR